MNQNINEINIEDQLNLLHQGVTEEQKCRESIPTLGLLLGIIVHGKHKEIRHGWVSVDGQSMLRIQSFQINTRNKTSIPIQLECITYRVHELDTLLDIILHARELASIEKEISTIEDDIIHNPTRDSHK